MRVKYATALSLLILACACGGDDNPQSPDDDTESDDSSSSARDAGTKDASTKDAGKASDAGSTDDAGKASDAGSTDAGKASDAGSTDAGKVTDAGKADAGGSACDTLTYESFGKSFLTNYCTSCHTGAAASKGVRLDTLAGVTAAKGKVKTEVAAGAMPPRGSKAPTAAEKTQFGQWIDCGPK